ncbi:hypothetical protein KI387_008003, partial [Taxus chinensis]
RVRKLWKSLRSSVAASGRAIKQKLKKKKNKRESECSHHYNFSDDDESDGGLGKKVRAWKIKSLGCVIGRSEIDSRKAQFVYVTDLYRSAPPALMAEADKTKPDEKDGVREEKGGASGSAVTTVLAAEQAVSRSSASCDDRRLNLRAEASPSSPSKRRKGVCWADSEEVDTEAEEFISKFYEDIKLQRQKSISEYREMLERGASSGSQ